MKFSLCLSLYDVHVEVELLMEVATSYLLLFTMPRERNMGERVWSMVVSLSLKFQAQVMVGEWDYYNLVVGLMRIGLIGFSLSGNANHC